MPAKSCSRCGEVKQLDAFGKDRTTLDGLKYTCRECLNVLARAGQKRRRQADPEKDHNYVYEYKQLVRAEVLVHYGTCCACCGTAEDLSVDHIDGNGAEHRQELFGDQTDRGGYRFQLWLRRNGFPPGYQILCRPCNASKRDTGACRLPHIDGFKRCVHPGHEGPNPLPFEDFNCRSDLPDGRQAWCRICANRHLRNSRNDQGTGEKK